LLIVVISLGVSVSECLCCPGENDEFLGDRELVGAHVFSETAVGATLSDEREELEPDDRWSAKSP
jgi:hypothetical protein